MIPAQSTMNAMKFDYEYMGKSSEELASTYRYPLDLLDRLLSSEGWARKIEPTSLPTTKDIAQFATELEAITRSKLSVISLFRQIDQQPMIAELENVFLEKALELVGSLEAADRQSASKLVNIVKAVTMIQERNPLQLADQMKEVLQDRGLVVNIQNNIQ